jgi:hypothetical protein
MSGFTTLSGDKIMMITGVPKNERWWLWAALLWIILSLGPGLELVNKPIFIGYFPLLYLWSFAFYIISLILICILCYRIKFHTVPEDIKSIYDEEKKATAGAPAPKEGGSNG